MRPAAEFTEARLNVESTAATDQIELLKQEEKPADYQMGNGMRDLMKNRPFGLLTHRVLVLIVLIVLKQEAVKVGPKMLSAPEGEGFQPRGIL